MFQQRRTTNLFQAAFTTFALIYHMTVYNLRLGQRNAVWGLLLTLVNSVLLIAGFFLMYWLIGLRSSPIRGDFMLFIMSGIFMFATQSAAMGAVSGAPTGASGLAKHGPLNTAVMIGGVALAVLYRQTLAASVLLICYATFYKPIENVDYISCYAIMLLAWFSGVCFGLIFLAIRPRYPQVATIGTRLFQRVNMITSGKMFIANTMPAFMLSMFSWNPLFHIVDQTRGYTFINYTPRNSNLEYPIYITIAVMMIGLMMEFVTSRNVSASWSNRVT